MVSVDVYILCDLMQKWLERVYRDCVIVILNLA